MTTQARPAKKTTRRWRTMRAVRAPHRAPPGVGHVHTFGLEDVGKAIEILGGEVPGEDGVHLSINPWM